MKVYCTASKSYTISLYRGRFFLRNTFNLIYEILESLVSKISIYMCVCPHPLLCVVVVFGWSRSIGGLGAEWQVFLQGGLLVQRGVAHVFIDRVYGHLSNVLRCL